MVQLQLKWGKGNQQKADSYTQGHRLTGLEAVFTSLLCSL